MTQAEAQLELDRIVQRIAQALEPEQIILFGSRAREDHRADSDADLLIVVPDGAGDPAELSAKALIATRGRKLPLDIVVYPHSSFQQSLEWQHDVVSYALEEGKVLYEAKHASVA
jgi:predicted nucleotidyltransferase